MTLDQIEVALRRLSDIDEDSPEFCDRLGSFVLQSIAGFGMDGLEASDVRDEIIRAMRDELSLTNLGSLIEESIMEGVRRLLDIAFADSAPALPWLCPIASPGCGRCRAKPPAFLTIGRLAIQTA